MVNNNDGNHSKPTGYGLSYNSQPTGLMNNGFGNLPTPNHIQSTNHVNDYRVSQRQQSFHYQEKDFPRLSTVEENPQMKKLSDAVQKIQSCVDLLMKQSTSTITPQKVSLNPPVQYDEGHQPKIHQQNTYNPYTVNPITPYPTPPYPTTPYPSVLNPVAKNFIHQVSHTM